VAFEVRYLDLQSTRARPVVTVYLETMSTQKALEVLTLGWVLSIDIDAGLATIRLVRDTFSLQTALDKLFIHEVQAQMFE
jgi:hypothetical protein